MKRQLVEIFFLVSSGVVINWLSDLFDLGVIVVLAVAIVVFAAMALWGAVPRSSSDASSIRSTVGIDMAKFALSALVLRALLTWASARVFYWTNSDRLMSPPLQFERGNGYVSFHLYELVATTFLTMIGVVAALHRRPLVQLASFLIPALTGMTLVVASRPVAFVFEGYASPALTFLGWLLYSSILVGLVYAWPDLRRTYADFLLGQRLGRNSNMEVEPVRDGRSPKPESK